MFKAQFINKVDPDPYPRGGVKVVLLTPKDIPAFLKLQQQVWNALPLRKKHHLKTQSVEELLIHFDAGMPVLGIKDYQGNMLVQAVLSYPMDSAGNYYLAGHPMLDGSGEDICALESMVARDDIAGQHMTDMVLCKAQDLAMQHGCPRILAKVSDDARLCSEAFERNGFEKTMCELSFQLGIPAFYYLWQKISEGEEKYMDPNSYPEYLYDMV